MPKGIEYYRECYSVWFMCVPVRSTTPYAHPFVPCLDNACFGSLAAKFGKRGQ